VYADLARESLVGARTAEGELRAGVTAVRAAEYRSRFVQWDRRASVRAKPERPLGWPGEEELYFPPELVPAVSHPLVAGRGTATVRRVLVQRLYQYLHFTTELEQLAVIPVASKISRGRSGLALPGEMRADAFKIVTDEAWHAQFSYDLLGQLERRTGVASRIPEIPRFVERLDAVRQRLDPSVRGAEALLFAIASETLISSFLSVIPNDPRIPGAVRDIVRDHAEDEGRHHAYFRSLLRYLWPALSARERAALGPWVPEIILAFVGPDHAATGLALLDAGLTADEIEQVLRESYPNSAAQVDAASSAACAVRYFAEEGGLDDPRTRDAFLTAGLIPDR
jgi:hypothetical protein